MHPEGTGRQKIDYSLDLSTFSYFDSKTQNPSCHLSMFSKQWGSLFDLDETLKL